MTRSAIRLPSIGTTTLPGAPALALIGSGHEADLRAALMSAARVVDRLTEQPHMQHAV
jgi:hypothetical protein